MTIATLFDDSAVGVAADETDGTSELNGAADGLAAGAASTAAGLAAAGAGGTGGTNGTADGPAGAASTAVGGAAGHDGTAAIGAAGVAVGAAGGVGRGAGFDVDSLVGLFASGLPVRDLADRELEARLVLVGKCESRLAAVKAEMVGELARRRGEGHAADVLRDGLRQSRVRAKQDVKLAEQLGRAPGTAEALRSGAITPKQAKMIAEAVEEAPSGDSGGEAGLLEAAGRESEDQFSRTVRDHMNEQIRDDLGERRKRQRERRYLNIKQEPDGMFSLMGRFDPVAGSRIETALTATANRLFHAEDAKSRLSSGQRMADALEQLVTNTGGDVGRSAGKAQGVDLLVVADYDTVAGQLRDARLVDGTPLSVEELLGLACDARILPTIFKGGSEPLWLGRGRRHASSRQRAVLTVRDKGCVGCGASANWCQAHHITHWEHGGRTDLDNLCLLCSYCHHHLVHTRGAEVVRDADGRFTLRQPDQLGNTPPTRRSAWAACSHGLAARFNINNTIKPPTVDPPLRR